MGKFYITVPWIKEPIESQGDDRLGALVNLMEALSVTVWSQEEWEDYQRTIHESGIEGV